MDRAAHHNSCNGLIRWLSLGAEVNQIDKHKPNKMIQEPIVIESTFDASADKIWQGITDKEQMKQWYFDLPDFKPEVGFSFDFEGGKDDKVYVHKCVVTEVVPKKRLSYSWHYEGYPGKSLVSFELLRDGTATTFRLIHSGIETFPANNPDFAKENFSIGWNYIIGTSLKSFLDKDK